MDIDRSAYPDVSDSQWEWLALMTSDEPLHEDLQPYVEEGEFGLMLKHPYVYEVIGMRPGVANKRYEQKKEAIAEAIRKRKWYTYIFLHERPWRTDALLTIRDRFGDKISDSMFWHLAGRVWVDSENIWQNFAEWDDILNTDRPRRLWMMDTEERQFFRKLPNELTVYRGSIPDLNEGGHSWTLDKRVARFFARRFNEVHGRGGVIDIGQVPKALCVAYFSGRSEEEIVVEHPDAVYLVDREHVR